MVTVFSKPKCGQCDDTKTMMGSLGIEYNEIDITKDAAAFKQVMSLGFRSAPVVVPVDGEPWAGFQRDKIESLASNDVDAMDDIFA